ncbi:MAG: thioesterase family protein [Deltaproteobacteria bacterium]|nr:thioesterase family protein [Deltaproteobacteria bacterium]
MPQGWRQGRGAFGGLTIASLIRAIELSAGDGRVVRTVTAELPGPTLAGEGEIRVEVLRAGKNATTARAVLEQGGEVKTHAVAILAVPPAGSNHERWCELEGPRAPAWDTIAPLPMQAGVWPEFAQHFEYRIVGGVPGQGAAAHTVGWVRPRDPGAARDTGYLAAVMDAWWPATLVRMRPPPHVVATVAFTLELVGGVAGLPPEAPLLYRGTVPVCEPGYFLETRELWGVDGRLVARNHQTFAIIQRSGPDVSQSQG